MVIDDKSYNSITIDYLIFLKSCKKESKFKLAHLFNFYKTHLSTKRDVQFDWWKKSGQTKNVIKTIYNYDENRKEKNNIGLLWFDKLMIV